MNASPRVIWALALGLATGLLSALPYGRATEAVAQDAAPATKPEFKTLSFDEAMQGQLVRSMPLKLAFPADYEMLVLDPAINGVVWARRADLDHIAQTKETSPDGGLFHGRLTTRIGYDRASNSFIWCPGCSEKDVKAELEAAGANDVQVQKHVINGIPMLLLDMGTANMRGAVRNKLYMAYVAVLTDTNVMLISYSPPLDSKDEGQTAWQAFTRALTQGVVSAEPPASKPPSFANDLAQATRSATFRPVADAFIAALVAGDAAKGMNMISPNLIKAVGRDTVQGVLHQTLPFFATFKEFGRSQTIARTGDEFGNEGFVFYLTMVPAQGNARPFAVYVVEENGAKVVANLLLDHDRSKVTAR